uniref:Serine/threonine-protein kinase n=1 Tax=Eiseniibacteriota bacterium TaxID=2212470 RepID=A0A832I4D1_UNCEI
MAIAPGTRLGPYEMLGPLGAGGMGEVYRARDPRLDRTIAIKLLPDAFAADPERLARFEREARLLASLHHPNIATLHGLEEHAGRRFIAMEYVDGVSLAERLQSGPLPVDEALDVACQVATALEAAHEGGVVHRDLKPGNIMLAASGAAKVLDFGLAKGVVGSASDTSLSASPTLTYAATTSGAILGTAAYMSPEQARGKPVDRRTDIWAFGCVLYECLTGRQAFEGETVSDLIAAILKSDVAWEALPAETPVRVRELLRRCLERDPRQRLRDIGEARLTLEQPHAAGPAAGPTAAPSGARHGVPLPLALGLAAALAAVAGAVAWVARPVPAPRPVWSEVAPPNAHTLLARGGGHLALSRDGRWLASVLVDSAGTHRIGIRDFESGATQVIAGTEEASYPFWSPDGRGLGFFQAGKLMRYDVAGGALSTVATAPDGRGGTWNEDDVIVFAPLAVGGLSRVSAAGGDVQVLVPDSLRKGYRFPHFLPGGKHFIAAWFESAGVIGVEVRSLDGSPPRRLPMAGRVMGNVQFADGMLFYAQEGGLRARPFDPARCEFTGEAITVASAVAQVAPRGRGDFVVAPGGVAVFRAGRDLTVDQVVIRDRGGAVLERLSGKGAMEDLQLSPDGRALLWSQGDARGGSMDVWNYDLARRTPVRLSFSGRDDDPVWSPDGLRAAWQGMTGIKLKAASGAGTESVAFATERDVMPLQWTPGGGGILFGSISTHLNNDGLSLLDPATGHERVLLATDAGHVRQGQVSPDGRWLAYASYESGTSQIYVQDYPGLRGRWQASVRGGFMPRWRRDAKELFYVDIDGRIHGLSVAAQDSSLALGNPAVVMDTEMSHHVGNRGMSWDVDALGIRFYTLEPRDPVEQRPTLAMVRGWRPTSAENSR